MAKKRKKKPMTFAEVDRELKAGREVAAADMNEDDITELLYQAAVADGVNVSRDEIKDLFD